MFYFDKLCFFANPVFSFVVARVYYLTLKKLEIYSLITYRILQLLSFLIMHFAPLSHLLSCSYSVYSWETI